MMGAIAWLDPVLGSTAKLRVLRILSRTPEAWFTEAELARGIGMSPNTVNLTVRSLAGAGIVRVLVVGRGHQVTWNRDAPLGAAILELFRSETKAVELLAEAIRSVLRETETCVLFGSAARGTMTAASDVDLLVIGPDWDAAAEASVKIGQAARRVYPAKYRMLHYTPSELRKKRNTPLLRTVRQEGVLLGGKPLEEFL